MEQGAALLEGAVLSWAGAAGQLWTDPSGGIKLRMGLIMIESGPVCIVGQSSSP